MDSSKASWLQRGRLAMRWLLSSRCSLSTVGFDFALLLRALLLTVLVYFVFNIYLTTVVDRAYRAAVVPAVTGAASTDDAVDAAITITEAPEELKRYDFVTNAFRQRGAQGLGREQILALVNGAVGDESNSARERLLDDQMTGRRRGWPGFALEATPPSGSRYLDALSAADPTWKHKLESLHGEQGADIKAFLARFFDQVALQVRPELRNVMRYNGLIQWITIYAFWVSVLLVFQRWLLLRDLELRGWFPPARQLDASGVGESAIGRMLSSARRRLASCIENCATFCFGSHQPAAASAQEFARDNTVVEILERRVYGVLLFVVGILPSLGFIGTVLGMGDALLRADSLFHAADKTAALGEITSHLGYAFDTTLIGLVAGLAAGVCVLAVRLYEEALWHRAQDDNAEIIAEEVSTAEASQPFRANAG